MEKIIRFIQKILFNEKSVCVENESEDIIVKEERVTIDQIDNNELISWVKTLGDDKKLIIRKRNGKNNETNYQINLYTEKHEYVISAHGERYLGCILRNRAPYPGEGHTRGNDLPDGNFSYETWIKIITSIVSHELLQIK